MIVTTIDLLNYLRCPRYAPLDRLSQQRRYNQPNLDDKFDEIVWLSGLSGHEKSWDADDEESTESDSTHFSKDLLKSSIEQLKNLTRKKLAELNPSKSYQEHITIANTFQDDYTLTSKLDFYYYDKNEIEIATVMPISDKELSQLTYSVLRDRTNLFLKNIEGVWFLNEFTSDVSIKNSYHDKLHRLMDRHTPTGRHFYHLAWKSFILNQLGQTQPHRHFLAIINHLYTFDGAYDEANNPIYSSDLMTLYDVSPIIKEMQSIIEIDLFRMINHIELNDDSRCPLVKNECQKDQSFECQFVDYCFSHVPSEHSIFHYFSQHQGFVEKTEQHDVHHDTYDLVNEGIVHMDDIPISWLHREKNLMQRYCVDNQYTYLNKEKVKAYLNQLRYPIYYLDFEAYPSMLPRYQGESPYSQSVFQFSLHVEQANRKIDASNPETHFYFLGDGEHDQRLELIRALIKAIGDDGGSIVVYNQTFERNRLLEFAQLFPEYARALNRMIPRLFDLYKVVKNDPLFYAQHHFSKKDIDQYNFYSPSMDGSYSLKKVFPALCNQDYSHLVINNGEAAYLNYAKLPSVDNESKQTIREHLLAYCQLDTYAMYLMVQELFKRIS